MIKSTFVVSASLVLAATHAMAAVQDDIVEVPGPSAIDPETSAQIEKAVSRPHVQEAVNAIFDTLARKFSEEGVMLSEKYFNDPDFQNHMLAQANTRDSSDVYTACYANCYSACHSACHGSRGWR